MPKVVMMQVVRLNAHRSVGENADPMPLLSVGASVKISVPLCKCTLLQRNCPRYLVLAVAIQRNYAKPTVLSHGAHQSIVINFCVMSFVSWKGFIHHPIWFWRIASNKKIYTWLEFGVFQLNEINHFVIDF